MSNMIETITIKRNEPPYRIEVGFHTPSDGLDLVDVAYIDFDDRRLEPVGDDIAINILDLSTELNKFMTDMVPRMRSSQKGKSMTDDTDAKGNQTPHSVDITSEQVNKTDSPDAPGRAGELRQQVRKELFWITRGTLQMAQNIWINADDDEAISMLYGKLDAQYYHQQYGEDDGSYRTKEAEDAIMQLIDSATRTAVTEERERIAAGLPEKIVEKPEPPHHRKNYPNITCMTHKFKAFRCTECGGIQASYDRGLTDADKAMNRAVEAVRAVIAAGGGIDNVIIKK